MENYMQETWQGGEENNQEWKMKIFGGIKSSIH